MLVAEYDYDTDIAVQREESLRIGVQQGFSDGAHQNALQNAGNLKRLGVSIEIIAKATGLSKQEVEALN